MGHTVKGTIREMQLLAKSKEGICLSKTYINSKTKLCWECKYGHRWQATPLSVKNRKSWCPVCACNQPLGIDEMHRLATIEKGKCLSKDYVNVKTKLSWECKEGHRFEATPVSIRMGVWCKKCK